MITFHVYRIKLKKYTESVFYSGCSKKPRENNLLSIIFTRNKNNCLFTPAIQETKRIICCKIGLIYQ